MSAAELVSKVQVKQSQTIHEYNYIQCMFVHSNYGGGVPSNNSYSDVSNTESLINILLILKQ